ncbi:hypothetical protein E2C01_030800 [Portunus trituberculatus]|uniref:Uncharacterized protein n=1 Tax=Portunus trituberculatus TaxID=210409 RepID=A0A5B7EVW0_PORTR|nr:hypothetical protein [Portunus trituberculatus]
MKKTQKMEKRRHVAKCSENTPLPPLSRFSLSCSTFFSHVPAPSPPPPVSSSIPQATQESMW